MATGIAPASADVSLPHIYSDHMVFQQKQPIPLRGMANPAEKISVSMTMGKRSGTVQTVTAGADGGWSVMLSPRKAGGPYRITVSGQNQIVLDDVLVGEVWFCSGQSNMASTLPNAKDAASEIAAATHPKLRVFTSNFATRTTPQSDLITGKWLLATKENASQFSSVGYLFGRDLQQTLNVPVGIIVSAAGGTLIESWLNPPALSLEPPSISLLTTYQKQLEMFSPPLPDNGWQDSDHGDTDWKQMNVPGAWETSGKGMDKLDGAVWFRREVTIPDGWAGKPLVLNFAPIDDGDVTYFNGVKVGAMNVDTPSVWTLPRRYAVSGNLVKAGRAVIATRITDQLGGGGFIGKPEEMWLGLAEQPETRIPLDGPWKYNVVERWPDTGLPTSLYNGMVAPWTSFPVAGVIWYQGESNTSNPANYSALLPKLIQSWRTAWRHKELPFLVVQLPGYGADGPLPAESNWAELREVQAQTASSLKGVGLAVTIDLGEVKDIHPKNKQDVAARLAKLALYRIYERKLVATGPVCDGVKIEGSLVRLHFKNAGTKLVVRGDELSGFAIAGKDRKFVWGKAQLKNQEVIVQSDQVTAPVYVRYGWANSPVSSLCNAEGFPTAPFRTENEKVIPGG